VNTTNIFTNFAISLRTLFFFSSAGAALLRATPKMSLPSSLLSKFVVLPFGSSFIDDTIYYSQVLKLAGLRHFTFRALRHTFASRAMEQGMDEKTLSTILGHYSVSFTLDTYAHVLHEHLNQEMGCMEELYSIDRAVPQNLIYPVIVTPAIGNYVFQIVDFPEIQMTVPTVEEGQPW
jgi:hypothetical protein